MRISDWSSDVCSSDLTRCTVIVQYVCMRHGKILVRRGMMLQNAGLVLSDGTTLDDLIDREMNEVSLRVMTDEELYRLEMERIRSEEHTSELQSLMRISYAVFCLKKKKTNTNLQNY